MTQTHAGELQNLLKHMEWADAVTWTTVLGLANAQTDDRLVELLHHVHTVQRVYLHLWRGEPVVVTEKSSFADLPAVADWARSYYADSRSFVAGLREEDLSREITFPWAEEVAKQLGTAGPATLAETVLQVVLHSTHHRAQIATRVRALGHEPPQTDFIVWLWMRRPEPAW